MATLSFSKGIPIARIDGGKYNKKIVHIFDPDKDNHKHLENEDYSSDEEMDATEFYFPKIRLIDKGIIVPLPSIERECGYITGPSGSGKSTVMGVYGTEYKKKNKKKDIILFSNHKEDEALDHLKPTRIEINNDLIDDPISMEELKNSLVIFDDATNGSDKKINDAVLKLQENLLENGRKQNIHVLISNHLASDYKNTRKILNECNSIVFFPAAGATHNISYVLRQYFGLDNKNIKQLLKLPSRWVMFRKNYPQCVLYQKGVFLLNSLDNK